MGGTINKYQVGFNGATVLYNSVEIGSVDADGVVVRLKLLNQKWGKTQSNPTEVTKQVSRLFGCEVEFTCEEVDGINLAKAMNALQAGSADGYTAIGPGTGQVKGVPYSLVIRPEPILAYPSGAYRQDITITNCIPSQETMELLYGWKKQTKVKFKFIATGAWTITDATTAV